MTDVHWVHGTVLEDCVAGEHESCSAVETAEVGVFSQEEPVEVVVVVCECLCHEPEPAKRTDKPRRLTGAEMKTMIDLIVDTTGHLDRFGAASRGMAQAVSPELSNRISAYGRAAAELSKSGSVDLRRATEAVFTMGEFLEEMDR